MQSQAKGTRIAPLPWVPIHFQMLQLQMGHPAPTHGFLSPGGPRSSFIGEVCVYGLMIASKSKAKNINHFQNVL